MRALENPIDSTRAKTVACRAGHCREGLLPQHKDRVGPLRRLDQSLLVLVVSPVQEFLAPPLNALATTSQRLNLEVRVDDRRGGLAHLQGKLATSVSLAFRHFVVQLPDPCSKPIDREKRRGFGETMTYEKTTSTQHDFVLFLTC